jgi:hypothetical protein
MTNRRRFGRISARRSDTPAHLQPCPRAGDPSSHRADALSRLAGGGREFVAPVKPCC